MGISAKNNAPCVNICCAYRAAAWLLPASPAMLKKYLAAMLACADNMPGMNYGLELNLVDDAEIARLNMSELGVCGPTNIISFPGAGILALSLDTFSRECHLYGQNSLEHLIRLLAHGFGHLAGFDHSPEMDAFCLACETAALKAAGD